MKTMEEISQLLSQQAPSDPLVKLLNDTFGPLGWEFIYESDWVNLKVMAKVTEGHFLSVTRSARNLISAAAMFGLEVKNVEVKASNLEPADGPHGQVGTESNRVEGVRGEPDPAVPTGVPRPSRKVINDSISECSRVILAKKLRTQEQLVKMVEAFAVKRKEELNEGQALKLLEQLKEVLQ